MSAVVKANFLSVFFYSQRFHTQPEEFDDGIQSRCDLWPYADALPRGDCGRHDEHQISKHCGGNSHRELREGKAVLFLVVLCN